MKKGLFWTILALLLAAVVCAASAATSGEVSIVDYGAAAGDGQDDSKAINEALEAGKGGTVIIPAGDWNVGSELLVFSNTELKADDNAVIHSSIEEGPILREGGNNAGGYSKAENITITGGTWLAYRESPKETQGLCFHHSKNITIRNLKVQDMSGHAINLSGVDTGRVSNVEIRDQKQDPKKTGDEIYSSECVHLDYCTEVGEQTYGLPYDGTESKNITVTGCTFRNIYTGVGNHREAPSGAKKTSNITVSDCQFYGLKAYAVSEIGMKGMKVTGCRAEGVPILVFLRDVTGIEVRGNTIDGGSQTYGILDGKPEIQSAPISINKCSGVTVADNTIKNLSYSAVVVFFDGSVKGESVFSGNKIDNVTGKGLRVQYEKGTGEEKVTLSGNELSGIGSTGIYIKALKDAVISGNTVDASAGVALNIDGSKDAPTSAKISENTLATSSDDEEVYDLRLVNDTECTLEGNTLKNYRFYHSPNADYTADFPKMKAIILEKENYEYTGKKVCPEVQVEDAAGRILTEGKDYKVFYFENTKVGNPNTLVKVKGTSTGMFTGQLIQKKFLVVPRKVKSPSLKAGKGQLTVKWKYDSKNEYDGYQIEYSLKSNFKKAQKITVEKETITEAVIENLKKGKTYYVRIRARRIKKGKTYYSDWSKTLKKKVN